MLFLKHGSESAGFFQDGVTFAFKFRDGRELDGRFDVVVLFFEVFELLFETFHYHFGGQGLVAGPETFFSEICESWGFGFEGFFVEHFLQFDIFFF